MAQVRGDVPAALDHLVASMLDKDPERRPRDGAAVATALDEIARGRACGIHTPVQGSVTLGAGQPARFDLKNGEVYEVAVFQAERQTSGSSYRLTLSGFSAAPSECTAICGDGILSLGEECDDGRA